MITISYTKSQDTLTGGDYYLVKRYKRIFWNVGINVFPNEDGQKHLANDTIGQLNSKEKDGYRVESEKVLCLK